MGECMRGVELRTYSYILNSQSINALCIILSMVHDDIIIVAVILLHHNDNGIVMCLVESSSMFIASHM